MSACEHSTWARPARHVVSERSASSLHRFLDYFHLLVGQGKAEHGYFDVAERIKDTCFKPTSKHREGVMRYAKSDPNERTPLKLGSDVTIEVQPPGMMAGLLPKRVNEVLTDIFLAVLVFPFVGLVSWYILRGVGSGLVQLHQDFPVLFFAVPMFYVGAILVPTLLTEFVAARCSRKYMAKDTARPEP